MTRRDPLRQGAAAQWQRPLPLGGQGLLPPPPTPSHRPAMEFAMLTLKGEGEGRGNGAPGTPGVRECCRGEASAPASL